MSQIKAARESAGFTQKQLAERMKVSITVVGYWEQGTRSPALRRLKELARILRVNVKVLLDEKMQKVNGRLLDQCRQEGLRDCATTRNQPTSDSEGVRGRGWIMTAGRLLRLATDLESQARITREVLALLEDESLVDEALREEAVMCIRPNPLGAIEAYRALLRAKLTGE
jgi:transcriptional regulator with XRE-family HTH domain